jgi:hypothetical protein
VGGRHQRQDPGVARLLVERSAQVADGVVGPVGIDQPPGSELEAADMAGVLGEHGVDEGGAFLGTPLRREKLGQQDLGVPPLVRRLGLRDNRLERGDRLRAVPLAHVEPRERPPVGDARAGSEVVPATRRSSSSRASAAPRIS